MSNLIDHSLTPTVRDCEVAAAALAWPPRSTTALTGVQAVDSLALVIASVRVQVSRDAFREAKRLAVEECSKYIARFRKASEATSDIQAQFSYRDMIRAAESCKGWIETIKEPA